ncbi:MAG: hypothetical protein AVDCRST_MAG16-3228, partial [uncultured Frankineae bacterium]
QRRADRGPAGEGAVQPARVGRRPRRPPRPRPVGARRRAARLPAAGAVVAAGRAADQPAAARARPGAVPHPPAPGAAHLAAPRSAAGAARRRRVDEPCGAGVQGAHAGARRPARLAGQL